MFSPVGSARFNHHNYMVLEELGRGGMGVVYKCKNQKTLLDVAVKVISYDPSDDDVIRFHREAKLLGAMQHPNILPILDFGHSDDGSLFLTMTLLTGRGLDQILEGGEKHVPFLDALNIFVQICDGLTYAHSKDILHRDIKPSNIFVERFKNGDLKVTITDFGLGKLLTEDQYLTKTGLTLGSPPYMSPEQCSGKPADARADIYSIGCLMFEVLTGAPPFRAGAIPAVMMQHVRDVPPKLADVAPDFNYPEEMEAIIAKCLEKDPNARYSKTIELREDLYRLHEQVRNAPCDYPSASTETGGFLKTGAYLRTGFHKFSKAGTSKVLVAVILAVAIAGTWGAFQIYKSKSAVKPHELDQTEPVIGFQLSYNQNLAAMNPSEFASKQEKKETDEAGIHWARFNHKNVEPKLKELLEANQRVAKLGIEASQYIDLSNSDISDESLKLLADLPLRGLKLNQTKISDDGVNTICKMKHLADLGLDNTMVTDRGVTQIGKTLGQLTNISLSNTKVTDAGVKALSGLQLLKWISLNGCKQVTGTTLSSLTGMKELFLNLGSSGVKSSAFTQLKDVDILFLDLSSLKLNDRDLAILESTRLPSMETLILNDNPDITIPGFYSLSSFKSLVALYVIRCPNITEKAAINFHEKHYIPPTVVYRE
ncbi:MAG: protein kinase [Candidatus Obscuribacterales bacterium]|nr:protein kinase [Candidatus Obscuribacterales bacterium]